MPYAIAWPIASIHLNAAPLRTFSSQSISNSLSPITLLLEYLPCASVAKDDKSQYMYDCDNGPVVCTKKYGKKDVGYNPSSQSILPGLWRLNLVCIIMDQM